MSVQERTIRSNVLAGSNAADSAVAVWPYTEKGRLKRSYIENLAAITASDTDYITVSATQNGTAIFSRPTTVAGTGLTAGEVEEQTLGAGMVGDKLEVEQGDVITFAVAEAGTGPAYELNICLVYELSN